MIGLDTNVLVRYVVQDDPRQSPKATRLIEALTADAPGHITTVSVIELVWVLQSCYAAAHDEIANVLEQLLRTKEIVVESADTVWKALRVYHENVSADFADCLIERSAAEAGCGETLTFDRKAVKVCGMKLID
jgi:predicted nucleic-acid-binding protein